MNWLENWQGLKEYWWLILIFLVGIFINVIKALCHVNHKDYLKNKSQISPHHDNNAKWNKDN